VDASISVLISNRPATATYSGQLALDLVETQYEDGPGPCLDAATVGELVEVSDARAETRWPEYMHRAVERGSLSWLSVPLPIEGLAGGLTIYATEAGGFGEATRTAADQFARCAAAAISNVHAYQTAQDMVANLEIALNLACAHRPGEGRPHGAGQADRRTGLPAPRPDLPACQRQAAGRR